MDTDTCFEFSGLNSYKRNLLHKECELRNLFHWSQKLIEKQSNFYVSTKQEHENKHLLAKKRYDTKNKSTTMRLDEINDELSNLCLSSVRRRALEIESVSIVNPCNSNMVNECVQKVLNKSPVILKKTRGRPRKNNNQINTAEAPTTEPRYLLRKRN